jgi:hypothetical protein
MRTPHKGTLWIELSRYFEKVMGGAGEMREQETNCQQPDNLHLNVRYQAVSASAAVELRDRFQ